MRIRDFEIVKEEQFIKDCRKHWNRTSLSEETLKKCFKNVSIPRRATSKSSGYDFVSPFYFTLTPSQTIKFPLGIKAYMLEDEELLLFPRSVSGIGYKIKIDNTIGKIDSDYYNNPKNEGDIILSLTNTGDREWTVEEGDKICQGSFYKYLTTDTDNPVKDKRVGGLGSTDVK